MPPKINYHYNQTDKDLIVSLSKKRLPNLKQLKYLGKFLKPKEYTFLSLGALLIIIGLFIFGYHFYSQNFEVHPASGGRYTEGSVGSPQYINPLYASLNSVDDDIAKVVFSSLFTRDRNGYLTNDLVQTYELSQDQKTYTFKIAKGVKWHDGNDLTTDDIIFTIETIQDPAFHSPLRLQLAGVEAKKIDDLTFSLTLPESYAPFIESLTFGIIPKNTWEEISANSVPLTSLNLNPIGSGPYEFVSLSKDKSGTIRSYTLTANQNYYRQKPFIDKIVFKFFASQEELVAALNSGQIDGASYLTSDDLKNINAKNSYNFNRLEIPENTALFFNLRNKDAAYSDKKVRQALALAINKKDLTNKIFGENVSLINSPINNASFGYSKDVAEYNYNLTEAKRLLTEAGWQLKTTSIASSSPETVLTKNNLPLEIKLTVADSPESIKTAEYISAAWQEMGLKVTLDIVNKNDLQSQILKPKSFSVLLYSWLVGVDPDPYLMWHSSQAGENGMNLSGYNNNRVDKLLEEARLNNNPEARKKSYAEFQKLITGDLPAVFLYSPRYIYALNKEVKGFNYLVITSPEDRLSGINYWYLKQSHSLKLQ
ncbi:MAG: peptide ABC transporter substrate-binding protein [Candidatus Falkowbacteria bacterium]